MQLRDNDYNRISGGFDSVIFKMARDSLEPLFKIDQEKIIGDGPIYYSGDKKRITDADSMWFVSKKFVFKENTVNFQR